jgi:nucleoside-diphosphate-sugar epimerase
VPVVVIGAAGFIGSHLVDSLVVAGRLVLAVDDLSTGRVENLERSIPSGRVSFVYADMCNTDLLDIVGALERNWRGKRFTTIYQLASRTEPEGDASLVRAAAALACRIVFVTAPSHLADNPAQLLSREAGVQTSTVVVDRCYGPRMRLDDRADRARPFDALLRIEPASTLPGEQNKSGLSYVDDVVSALLRAESGHEHASLSIAVDSHEQADVLSMADDVVRIAKTTRGNVWPLGTREAAGSLRRGIGATYAWYARSMTDSAS